MRVLVGCEFSGRVRDAFIRLGHDAVSCDLEASESQGPHIQGDLLEVIYQGGWDLGIFFPPCTHLCVSGAKHFAAKRADGRQQQGIDFFMAVANAPIPKMAIENPVGIMSTIWRKPDQIIQPYQFGDSFQKTTCLWLKNLPKLVPTNIVDKGEMVTLGSGKVVARWSAFAPIKDRVKIRNRTFMGIANAFAMQWGGDINAEADEDIEMIKRNAGINK
jgi:hypothetical protein